MNEVSLIINGVRYDAVDATCHRAIVCSTCDLRSFCDNIKGPQILCDVFDIGDEDVHFKKSDKKFEK